MKLALTEITQEKLDSYKPRYLKGGYPVPKWIVFCEGALKLGFKVSLHRAHTTFSKYIFITGRDGATKKVRFSNHKAAYYKEVAGDCDYYVGVGHQGIITTEQLLDILKGVKSA